MSDLFRDKAQDWDTRPLPLQISEGVGVALLRQVTLNPSMRVMDFGAGTGLICSRIAPHVASIVAVDISESMLNQLATKPELQGKVTIVCQNLLETPLDDKFDLIVSAMAMHHVQDTAKLLETFATHLKAGGKVALADLDQEDGTFHPADIEGVYHQGFERNKLQTLLEAAGFEAVEFVTATEVDKDGRRYPIFLATATKG